MATQRAHVVLPADLIEEIDKFVGPRGRSAFIAETARAELKKRKLLAWLNNPEMVWKDEDHPELADGAAAWVRKLRQQGDDRLTKMWAQAREAEVRDAVSVSAERLAQDEKPVIPNPVSRS